MSRGCLRTSSNEHIIRTNEHDGYTQLRWFPSQSDLWLIYVIYGLDSVMWDKQKLIVGGWDKGRWSCVERNPVILSPGEKALLLIDIISGFPLQSAQMMKGSARSEEAEMNCAEQQMVWPNDRPVYATKWLREEPKLVEPQWDWYPLSHAQLFKEINLCTIRSCDIHWWEEHTHELLCVTCSRKIKAGGCVFTAQLCPLLHLEPRDSLAAGLYLLMPAETVQERFSEHENKFRLMQRPAQPSDLRPVEHLRDEMAWAVQTVCEAEYQEGSICSFAHIACGTQTACLFPPWQSDLTPGSRYEPRSDRRAPVGSLLFRCLLSLHDTHHYTGRESGHRWQSEEVRMAN